MYSAPITYTDFNNREVSEILYFNISKSEIAEHMDLQDRFENLLEQLNLDGGERQLTRDEIKQILDLVKSVMKLAYGQRTEDGRYFRKSEEMWEDFQSSAAYDAYLFSLFTDVDAANEFLLGVLPQDLRESAEAEIAQKEATPKPPEPTDISDEDLLKMDPLKMTQAQLIRAMQIRTQQGS